MFRWTTPFLIALLAVGLVAAACDDDDAPGPNDGSSVQDGADLPRDSNGSDGEGTQLAYLLFNGETWEVVRNHLGGDADFSPDALEDTGETGDWGGDVVAIYTHPDSGGVFTRSGTENLEPGDPELWFEWAIADPTDDGLDTDGGADLYAPGVVPPSSGGVDDPPESLGLIIAMNLDYETGYVVGDYINTATSPDFDPDLLAPLGERATASWDGGEREVDLYTHVDRGGVWSVDPGVEDPADSQLWILWSPAG